MNNGQSGLREYFDGGIYIEGTLYIIDRHKCFDVKNIQAGVGSSFGHFAISCAHPSQNLKQQGLDNENK